MAAAVVSAAACSEGTVSSSRDLGDSLASDGGRADSGVAREPLRCEVPTLGTQQQVVVCSDQRSLVWARNVDGSLLMDRFSAPSCSSSRIATIPNPEVRAFVAGCGASDVIVSDHSIEETGSEIVLSVARPTHDVTVVRGKCLRSQFQRPPEAVARPDGALAIVKGCDDICVSETLFSLVDREAQQTKLCASELAISASLQFASLQEVDILGTHLLMSESVRLTEPPQRGLWRVGAEEIVRLASLPGGDGLLVPGAPALLQQRNEQLVLREWNEAGWSEQLVGPEVPGLQEIEDIVPLGDGFAVQLRTPCPESWPCSLGRVWLVFNEEWSLRGFAPPSETTFVGRLFGSTEDPLLLQQMSDGSWLIEEVALVPSMRTGG